jgi:hypothetical protein
MLLQAKIDEWQRFECSPTSSQYDVISQLPDYSHLLDDPMNSIEQDFWTELAQIQAESIGWLPLEDGAYLHVGSDVPVIQVVGIAKEEMADSNVLWLL